WSSSGAALGACSLLSLRTSVLAISPHASRRWAGSSVSATDFLAAELVPNTSRSAVDLAGAGTSVSVRGSTRGPAAEGTDDVSVPGVDLRRRVEVRRGRREGRERGLRSTCRV